MSTGNASTGGVPELSDSRLSRERVNLLHRCIAIFITLCVSTVFGVAVWLSPDVRGFGTHEQLGIPPCQFRDLSGWNCPHCGMTTSFSHFVRGDWVKAFQANGAGLILALTCVVLGVQCLLIGSTGRWYGPQDPMAWLIRGISIYLVITLVFWLMQFVPAAASRGN